RLAAAIHPAVPPPTMTMLRSRSPVIDPIVASPASELHAQGHPDGARHARDVAEGCVSAADDDSVGTGGVDEVDEVVRIEHVERVDTQVHRSHVAELEVLRDLEVQRLIAGRSVRIDGEGITRRAGGEGGGARVA